MDWATIIYYVSGFLIFVVIIIALVAQSSVQSAYSKYSQMQSSLNMTGGQLAEKLCAEKNLPLRINTIGGNLSDNYNSKDKSLNISAQNYSSNSIAALAIVAHEFGHALQDDEEYAPLKIRQIAIKVSNVASRFLLPFLLISIILSIFVGMAGTIMLGVVVIIYALALIANLVTLPVEINASNRAKAILNEMVTDSEEQKAVAKMLRAAAMTYVAALFVSLVYFLRFLSLFLISKRD